MAVQGAGRLTPEAVRDALRRGACPKCGFTLFVGGPCGGSARNVGCAGCDTWWNVCLVPEEVAVSTTYDVIFLHDIDPPAPGIPRGAPVPFSLAAKPRDYPPDPDCEWCHGTGQAPADFFVRAHSPRLINCLCRVLPTADAKSRARN